MSQERRRVIIESPYAGREPGDQLGVEMNLLYLRACMRDSIRRGESPFASHGLYTQPGVLNDHDPAERDMGIVAGFAWRRAAEATVVYTDRGLSGGMRAGIKHAEELDQPICYRTLGPDWLKESGARMTGTWGAL